ncbi:MAG: squalene/phytoene synthase family protein [bacterium]
MTTDNHRELDFITEIPFDEILTNPILDIAARFWDEERYRAFRVCYRSMRIIDDLIDDRRTAGGVISERERQHYRQMLSDFIEAVRGQRPADAFQQELVAVMRKFDIPVWPWERLARAMIYDLSHYGFPTFRRFLKYCEGAAVAPASVFMHLCGVTHREGRYIRPTFDSRRAARPLALFSYLVHIIRDFEPDQKASLNYFADDLLSSFDLKPSDLTEMVETGQIKPALRELIGRYGQYAIYYRTEARSTLDRLKQHLESRYRLSLEIVYGLYLQIFERINPERGSFSASDLNPRPEEIRQRIDTITTSFQRN